MAQTAAQLNVAIACGGTGGHLFPGVAVSEVLLRRGSNVTLLVSSKEIDQLAVKTTSGMRVVTLPAVGLSRGRLWGFLKGFTQSFRAAKHEFLAHPPQAVLAMGGFTSAPPILAGRGCRAATFLHESNTIPGRANRWLSRLVDHAFIGFPQTAERLRTARITVTGTPVRAKFQGLNSPQCRAALGLDPQRPVALVMGGSQGAHAINDLVLRSMDYFARHGAGWQWLHLAGASDVPALEQAYRSAGLSARVFSFCAEMELAMGAATAAVSRAGASSLAELAATRLPSILIPFPAATDNHQFYNAQAFEQTGAARLMEQGPAAANRIGPALLELMSNLEVRNKMQEALAAWHKPHAAEQIAEAMLELVANRATKGSKLSTQPPVPKPEKGSSSAHCLQADSTRLETHMVSELTGSV